MPAFSTASPVPANAPRSLNEMMSSFSLYSVMPTDAEMLGIVNRLRRMNPGDRDEFYTMAAVRAAARQELLDNERKNKRAFNRRKEAEKNIQ